MNSENEILRIPEIKTTLRKKSQMIGSAANRLKPRGRYHSVIREQNPKVFRERAYKSLQLESKSISKSISDVLQPKVVQESTIFEDLIQKNHWIENGFQEDSEMIL